MPDHSRGGGTIPVVLVLVADGFLVAGRCNKKLVAAALAGEESKAGAAPPQPVDGLLK